MDASSGSDVLDNEGREHASLDSVNMASVKPNETVVTDTSSNESQDSTPASNMLSSSAPLATPMSMSAGADPWADPPAYDREASLHDSRPAARENPWSEAEAEAEAKEVLASGVDGDQQHNLQDGEGAQGATHRGSNGSTSSAGPAKRPSLGAASSQDGGLMGSGQDYNHQQQQQRYTLCDDARAEEYDLPKLGKAAARYWPLKSGFLQLNSGSYGACPKPVMEVFKSFEDRQEENCDAFRRYAMGELLGEARKRLAAVLNADDDDVVLVPNATTGTNAVLRDLIYQAGDAVLTTSFTYPAVVDNITYLSDTERMRGIDLCQINVEIPVSASHDEILAAFEHSIKTAQAAGKRIRVAVIDVVASKPGILLPWKEMVTIARDQQILSLVDGAHGIGHMPIDLRSVDPDFFVSNCHKWLYAHRSCAAFYVPKRNRHIQRSSMPTSFYYTSDPTTDKNTWLKQWTGPGTLDVAPYLSVIAALEFREKLGGEARILNYNHDLAVRGGHEMARVLGTDVMDTTPDGTQTGAMTNVRLPIIASRLFGRSAAPANEEEAQAAAVRWAARADEWFFDALLTEFKTCIPVYAYGGKIWARASAQVWLDVDDFVYGARALRQLCERINQGTAPDFSDASQR